MKSFFYALGFMPWLVALCASAAGLSMHVEPVPQWNQYFERTNGWIGADVAYSIPLAADKTFWLFGDTFDGQVSDGQRVHARMIHSSIAIQRSGEAPDFYYPTNKKGAPESFMKSPDGKTDFWLLDGVRLDRGLFFFMLQMQWTGNSVWGFHSVGTWLATVANPDDPPARWKIKKKKLPFLTAPNGEPASFGSAILQSGGFIYVYGYTNPKNTSAPKSLLLARVPENRLDDFTAWEFYTKDGWTGDFEKTTSPFTDAPPEGSVSWQPLVKKFVFVYMDGIWGKIVMRTANAPEGPWSAPAMIYQCPEIKITPKVFCYAAKAHPELGGTNELLISYASNSMDPPEVMSHAQLYCPRFIRVKYEVR
jgi:hypothetical protein